MDDAWKLIRPRESSRRHLWIGQLCLTIAVGVAYFFAAEMSLALVTKPYGVAVFWPAAGISSGTLIALGSRVSLPVTLGVVTSSTEASLIANINIAASTFFSLSIVGEPLLAGGFFQRHFVENFELKALRCFVVFF